VLLPYCQQLHTGASGPGSDVDGVRDGVTLVDGVMDGVVVGVIDGVTLVVGVIDGVVVGVKDGVTDGVGGVHSPVSSVDMVPLFTVKIGIVVSSTQSYSSPINCIVVLGDIL
jgi:hypothetical protein